MEYKIALALWLINNNNFQNIDKLNPGDVPGVVAKKLGMLPNDAMALLGYLVDQKYIYINEVGDFSINEEKREEVNEAIAVLTEEAGE